MTDVDAQLVQRIADQVMQRLAQRQAASGVAASSQGPAQVRPPAGVCTGDYSKFVELASKPVTPPKVATAPIGGLSTAVPILTGIVTATRLQAAMDSAADGVVVLVEGVSGTSGARLTPLAQDLMRANPGKVQYATRPSRNEPASAANTQAVGEALPWLWWAQGFCPAVQDVTHRLHRKLQPSAAPRTEAGLAQVVGDLAAMVREQRVAGGLLFVEREAAAVCYANRCRSLIAASATRVDSLNEAIAQLGINVLVLPYPRVEASTIAALVERMIARSPHTPPLAKRQLDELGTRNS